MAAAIGNWAFRVLLAFLFALVFDAPLLWIWLVILADNVARAIWLRRVVQTGAMGQPTLRSTRGWTRTRR